jgi:alpha-tubulin suppressor-like RCC1 family protein
MFLKRAKVAYLSFKELITMTRIVTLLRLGAFFALFLLVYLFAGTEAHAAAPEVKSFAVPTSHRTLTVPIIRFTATDDVAVSGYMVTESAAAPSAGDAGWTVTPPPQYTFSTEGSKKLHAWVKDGDGTVSTSLSASMVVGSGEALSKTSISASAKHNAMLKSDGTVVAWGNNSSGQTTIPTGLSGVVAIAAGYAHTVALKSDGTVSAWGDNHYGQTSIPEGLTNVVAIAAGGYHTVALKSDGTVTAWGNDFYGQTEIPEGLTNVVAIAAGGSHTVALKSDGRVAAWGYNIFGQTAVPGGLTNVVAIAAGEWHTVAVKSEGTVAAWGAMTTIPAGLTNVMAIAAGYDHTVALKSDGTIVAWGDNYYGQTMIPAGLTGVVAIAAGQYHTVVLKSDRMVAAWGWNANGQATIPGELTNVVAIAAGQYHTAALKSDGTVAAWGNNSYGQTTMIPAELTNAVAIASGGYHTVALKSDGTVAAWGNNSYGQTTIPAGLTNVVAIAAGGFHTVALMSDGIVAAWGENSFGQTAGPGGLTNVVAIAAGAWHTVALKSDGTVKAWGMNTSIPAGLTNVVAIAAGYGHTVALKADGTIVAWGDNSSGQTTIPAGLSGVVAIAAGEYHTVVLKSDGTVAAWGENSDGQTPIPTGLSKVVAISAGMVHTVALKADGTVTAWGFTGYGESNLPAAGPDSSAPVIFRFSPALVSSQLWVTIPAFYASDDTEIACYLITESATSPSPADAGWKPTPPAFYAVGTYGSHTLYAWVKDAADNVSSPANSTVVVDPTDTTPDAFTFMDQTGVALNADITSAAITVTGINAASPISISGGTYSINNGAFVSSAGTVSNNDTVRVQVTASGSYGTTVDTVVNIGSVTDTFSATTKALNPGDLAEAVDNPQDITGAPLTFTTSGIAWFAQVATAINGSAAAQSGDIGNNQKSWFKTTVTGPCSVSFYQKVSSQKTFDSLEFSIDGVVKSTISGEVEWQQKSFIITTAGTHVLRWTYTKNASIHKGEDSAWVDHIVVSPTTRVHIVSPNGGEKLPSGGTYNITWKAPAGTEKFKLYYTVDNGVTWKAITTGYIMNTSYEWSVPVQNVNRTACKVKVVGYNNDGVEVANDLSNAFFTIEVLKITAPNGGESLTSGVKTTIAYTLNGTLTPISSISFYYSVDNGATWKLIGTVTDGFWNSYDWTPVVNRTRTSCKVKVVLKSATGATLANDVSDKVFTIIASEKPSILYTNPSNGVTDVDRNIKRIEIRFNREMAPGASVTYDTNWHPSDTHPTWSADHRTVYISRKNAGTPLPASTEFHMIFNEQEHPQYFRDTHGNTLDPFTLTFTTGP